MGLGKGRKEGGQSQKSFDYWAPEEQQPRGNFKDAISIDGIFKQTQIRSRRRISFQTLDGGRSAVESRAVQTIKSSMTMA